MRFSSRRLEQAISTVLDPLGRNRRTCTPRTMLDSRRHPQADTRRWLPCLWMRVRSHVRTTRSEWRLRIRGRTRDPGAVAAFDGHRSRPASDGDQRECLARVAGADLRRLARAGDGCRDGAPPYALFVAAFVMLARRSANVFGTERHAILYARGAAMSEPEIRDYARQQTIGGSGPG